MLERRRTSLEEVAEYRRLLKRPSKYSRFYEEDMASAKPPCEVRDLVSSKLRFLCS
jgi:hypothetical protein